MFVNWSYDMCNGINPFNCQPKELMHGLITDPNLINDSRDQILEKNKRPIRNKGDPGGKILKNK